jgi:hypothetical protein
VSDITETYLQTNQLVGACFVTAIYFRRLADRCLALSEECLELQAQEEFRKLAEELTAEANAVECEQNSSVGNAHGGPHRS